MVINLQIYSTNFQNARSKVGGLKRVILDVDSSITSALLKGQLETAVDLCLKDGRLADAIMLSIAGGGDLLAKTQAKYFKVMTFS